MPAFGASARQTQHCSFRTPVRFADLQSGACDRRADLNPDHLLSHGILRLLPFTWLLIRAHYVPQQQHVPHRMTRSGEDAPFCPSLDSTHWLPILKHKPGPADVPSSIQGDDGRALVFTLSALKNSQKVTLLSQLPQPSLDVTNSSWLLAQCLNDHQKTP